MLSEFGDFNNEDDSRSPEERALHKATKKQILTRKEEKESIKKQTENEDELDTLLDTDGIQASEIALAKQEVGTEGHARELEARLHNMEASLKSRLREYGDKSFKIDELNKREEASVQELNDMYNDLHEALTTKPPQDPRRRPEFFRQQKEMVSAVSKSRARLEMEVLRARVQIETLQDTKSLTEEEVRRTMESLEKIQSILRPGKNLSSN